MALTSAERTSIINLVVGMFNAAPGATYLAELTVAFEANGRSLTNLAKDLANTGAYKTINPVFQTAAEFAAAFLTPLGLQANAIALDFVTAKFNAGVSKGQIVADALAALNASTAAEFADAKAILTNKTSVAEYYSVTKAVAQTEVATLQAVLTSVTKDAATVATAKTAVDNGAGAGVGQVKILTTSQDNLVGGAANDVFTAGVGIAADGTTLVNTLQNVDQIDGSGGSDTLNVTLNGATTVTPSLKSIETVVLRSTTDGSALDLGSSTDVTNVTVSASTKSTTINNAAAVGSFSVVNQKTSTTPVTVNGSTATTLAVSADAFGTPGTGGTVGTITINNNKATTLNLTLNASNVQATAFTAVTTGTAAVTGANELTLPSAAATMTALTVTGAGSLKLSTAMTALKTLTAADGGVTVDTTGGVLETATTGGGADTLTAPGTTIKSISVGAGKDSVKVLTALAATSTVDLGAGDDTLTLSAAPAEGVTLTGGEGTDTLGLATADYASVSGFKTAANLAKITGFEVLSISDALTASTYDVSKIAGIGSFVAAAGITAGAAAVISNLGAASSVTLAGANSNGTATVSLKTDTTTDVLNLVLNQNYTENNDATATVTDLTQGLTATKIETLNVTSSGKASATFAGAAGNKADGVKNILTLTDADVVTLNVTGNQAFEFIVNGTAGPDAASMVKLATIDASALTAAATINGAAALGTSAALSIKGSATVGSKLTGGGAADTIVGGAGADTIVGGAKADTLTGGAGSDKFQLNNLADSTLVNLDTITDFTANTFGNGTSGAAGTGAGADATKWTGDVIVLNGANTEDGVVVSVQSNASDAQTFLQNLGADASAALNNAVGVALDSSTSRVYIDWNSDGTADSVIQLTGVTTLTAAAFQLPAA